jgi:selenocysteine lyase/cysteine desulfurase
VDAPALAVDFYGLSLYKTYGPHAGALYGTRAAWAALRAAGGAPNHVFITAASAAADAEDASPWYVWEPGGVCHEAAAALAGLMPYLRALAGAEAGGGEGADEAEDWRTVRRAFAAMPALEAPAAAALGAFFDAAHEAGRLRLLGPRGSDAAPRVPTFSFVPGPAAAAAGCTPASIVAACHAARVAVRHGHMYAPRLLRRLGVPTDALLPPDDADGDVRAVVAAPAAAAASTLMGGASGAAGGVVRVSAVHYNTLEEAQRCIAAIDAALGR